MENIEQNLARIRRAYDLTVEQYRKGIKPYDIVPEYIKNLPGYDYLIAGDKKTASNAPDIREYLNPESGMRYLDAGCCANLANYRLDKWSCVYYGVDISTELIKAMKSFVEKNHLLIGGLHVADIANLPFEDKFFDLATVIGVFEYCTMQYINSALKELKRVLKGDAKVVMDVPNLNHPFVDTMFKLEEYLGRPNVPNQRAVFEEILAEFFLIGGIDDSKIMLKYFVRAKNNTVKKEK